jgi:hypothetical protein
MLKRVPVFFEAWESHNHTDLQICRKVMRVMIQQHIAPLPFASKVDELKVILDTLAARQLEPGIFIINTYWAEEQLMQIDPLMPEHVPALFFRRGLSADVRARDLVGENPEYGNTVVHLNQMKPRLSSVWEYGKLTADSVAEKSGQMIARFLTDGNFRSIEHLGTLPIPPPSAP